MRLFVGIFPPAAVQRDLHATLSTAPRGPRLHWTGAAKLHLTLAFLGECSPHRTRELCAAVDAAAHGAAPFELVLHGLDAFPDLERPRVLFVDVAQGGEAVRAVHQALRAALPVDLRPEEFQGFRPHLTIARPKRSPRPGEMRDLESELAAWRWRFEAREIALVESVLGPGGTRYAAHHVTALVGGGPAG